MRGKLNDKKLFYYVMVITEEGPVFITDIPSYGVADWNKNKKPLELGKSNGELIPLGLALRGRWLAYTVISPFELDEQPYCYDKYHIEIEPNKEVENENVI